MHWDCLIDNIIKHSRLSNDKVYNMLMCLCTV